MIKNILKGIVIGMANIIPGVSGGTMAVSMGIYDKLLHCVTHIFKEFKKSILFLLPIFVGAGIALVGLSFVIQYMFTKFPFQTNCLFIGLIIGGLPAIGKKVKGNAVKVGHIIACLLFFALVVGLAAMGETEGAAAELTLGLGSMVKLFGVGVIASATMVVPGVSGSMILLLMGYYNPIIDAITNFIKALVAFDLAGIINGMGILAPFGVGMVIGIFAIAKLIELIFEKFPQYAYWAIIGLILSSPVAIMLLSPVGSIGVVTVITGILTLLAGTIVALKLGD